MANPFDALDDSPVAPKPANPFDALDAPEMSASTTIAPIATRDDATYSVPVPEQKGDNQVRNADTSQPIIGSAKDAWDLINTPLIDAKVPDDQIKLFEHGTPMEQRMLGVREGLDNFLSSITSPLSVGTLGIAGVLKGAPMLAKALSVAFAAQMGKHLTGDVATELGNEMGKPKGERDDRKIAQLLTESAAMTPMVAHLGVDATAEPITKNLAPKTYAIQQLSKALTEGEGKAPAQPQGTEIVQAANNPIAPNVFKGEIPAQTAPTVKQSLPVEPPVAAERKESVDYQPVNISEQQALSPDILKNSKQVYEGGPEPSESDATSIKNAIVDSERVKRGLPPVIEPLKRSFGKVWEEAMAEIQKYSGSQDALIAELADKPRALTDKEDAMVLHRQIELQNEYSKATEDLAKAYDEGREEDIPTERNRVAIISDQLQTIYDVGKQTGTETARGLSARRMMAREDFTLAAMEMQKRAANDGKTLTDAQREEITQLHKKIAETQKAYDEYVSKTDERLAKLEAERKIAELGALPKSTTRGERLISALDKRAEAARGRIKERLKRTSASVDPSVLIDLAEIGASHLGHAALNIADFSAKMVSEFGDWVKPHLNEIYKQSQDLLKKHGFEDRINSITSAIGEKVKDGKRSEISMQAQNLARVFIEKGVRGRDAIVAAVHGKLKEVIPDITERETMDSISGYGDFKQLSQDQISKELRDIKGQLQQVAKLEDIQSKKPIEKTGVERREPSDEERRLIKQVNEAKRKYGVVTTDPATQLKSILESRKTYYRNQISDLETQIASRDKIVKTKTGSPSDAELDGLKARAIELKKQFDDIFGKQGITDEQRLEQLKKLIEERKSKLAAGDLSSNTPKAKQNRPLSPELEKEKQELEDLNRQMQEARNAVTPKKSKNEIALEALKTRLKNRTEELKSKLAAGDFTKKSKPIPKVDAELFRLKAQNERVKKDFQRGLLADTMKKRSGFEKTADALVKWRRFAILSGPATLGKLTGAAFLRIGITPFEEGIGYGFSKALPDVASKAPRHGGGSIKTEANAISKGLIKGVNDAVKTIKTGQSDLDVLFGKEKIQEKSWLDLAGNIHGALKAPVKRVEFERSLIKRTEQAAAAGVDITDPLVQTRLMVESYKDANRSIFMQDNRLVSAYKSAIARLEQPDKQTGKTPVSSKAISAAIKVSLPVVKVPTNIAAEIMEYATGSFTGSLKLAKAYRNGMEKLTPDEADLILRNLKKGSLGGAILLLGFFNPQMFGGYYQKGEKRNPSDIKSGEVKLGETTIPPYLVHNPTVEQGQLGATIRRVADSKLKKKDSDTQGIPAGLLAGALGVTEEVPFVRDMVETAKAFDPHQRGKFFSELGKSVAVPKVLDFINQKYKDYETNSFAQSMETLGF